MNSVIIFYSVLCFALLFVIGKVSYKLNLVDVPNKRKLHFKPTAYTGGIAISIAFVLSILLLNVFDFNLNLLLSFTFLMSLVGLLDDKYDLNIGSKLSLQIILIFYLITTKNLSLFDLGDYNYFKLELGSFAIPVTLIFILFLINSFNYFDGIDGTLSFTIIAVLINLFFLISDQNIRLFIIIIFIPLSIFLCFNFAIFKLPKLFLGDSGSLSLGFIISFFLIYLANKNLIHPILIAWTIVIFAYEFLSINLIRLIKKKNLFEPGRDHLHHFLFNKSKSILVTNFLITTLNFVLFIMGYISFVLMNSLISLFLFIFFFIIYFFLRIKI